MFDRMTWRGSERTKNGGKMEMTFVQTNYILYRLYIYIYIDIDLFKDIRDFKVSMKLWHFRKKNKMKPTNPNADTYVDKQRQYLFVTFPANSLVRHPEFTHWSNTLVGHPCLTLLRNALVRDACLTLLWDTLVRHFLLDTLVRQGHSYLTLLTWHSCKTLL